MADQVLTLARLVEGGSETRSFTPASVGLAFESLGLPSPGRARDVLARLRRDGLVVTLSGRRGQMRLSPKGVARGMAIFDDLDVVALAAEATRESGPFIGRIMQTVLPPFLAPAEVLGPVRDFVAAHPFDRNVFGMTRFPDNGENGDRDDPPDPVAAALVACKEVCALHGLEFHLASDRQLVDDLWANVFAHMWASRYGIAFFESATGRGINYNLTIEVGSMLALGRRTALLRDKSMGDAKMPSDLVGKVYKSVDFARPSTVRKHIHSWLRDDIALGPCSECG